MNWQFTLLQISLHLIAILISFNKRYFTLKHFLYTKNNLHNDLI